MRSILSRTLIALALLGVVMPRAANPQTPPRRIAHSDIAGALGFEPVPLGTITTDPYTSPEAISLGGSGQNDSRSLTIRGQPYGYYDTGALVSIVDTSLPFTSTRAGINGGFQGGVPNMAAYPDFDSVYLYLGGGATPPRLTVTGVTYDSTHIYPAPGTQFSGDQLKLLRPSMWVMTNSTDTTVSTVPPVPNALPPLNTYGSTVLSWSPSSIVVSGWTVPGSGHASLGQVPTPASPQTVVFGSATKQFARNIYMQHNPGIPGAAARAYEAEEADLIDNGTTDYSTSWHGYTVQYTPFGIVPASGGVAAHNVMPTADSWGIHVGGPLPTLLHLRGGPTTHEIDADSLILLAGMSPGVTVGSKSLLSDATMYVDSNRAHLLTYMTRDAAGAGPTTAAMHFGLRYDSTFGALDGSGTGMAEVVFNRQGYYGGLSLCAASGACGLNMANSGTLTLPNGLIVSNGGFDATGFATMRTGAAVVGGLTADKLTVAQHTPASSTEACSPGQTSDDATYHYWCATTNHWLRVAGATF